MPLVAFNFKTYTQPPIFFLNYSQTILPHKLTFLPHTASVPRFPGGNNKRDPTESPAA